MQSSMAPKAVAARLRILSKFSNKGAMNKLFSSTELPGAVLGLFHVPGTAMLMLTFCGVSISFTSV